MNAEQHRDEQAGLFTPSKDEWVPWTGRTGTRGRGGWARSPRPQLVFGEFSPGATPHVVLADGSEPTVLQLGGVWMCEWVSVPQPVTVTIGPESWVVPLGRRPNYLPEDYEGS